MQTIDQHSLNKLASPNDTRAVRVVLRQVQNLAPYTVSGRTNQYVLTYDPTLCAHTIDVPESVWMNGIPGGAYQDNHSVAHDIQANRAITLAPLVCLIVPMQGGQAIPHPSASANNGMSAPAAEFLAILRDLFSKTGAPPVVMDAMDIADQGDASTLRDFVGSVVVQPPQESNPEPDDFPETEAPDSAPPATGLAERMQKMREAKAAKKQLAATGTPQ